MILCMFQPSSMGQTLKGVQPALVTPPKASDPARVVKYGHGLVERHESGVMCTACSMVAANLTNLEAIPCEALHEPGSVKDKQLKARLEAEHQRLEKLRRARILQLEILKLEELNRQREALASKIPLPKSCQGHFLGHTHDSLYSYSP